MLSTDIFRRRQANVLDCAHEQNIDVVVAAGRSFYDRPGMMAWLSNHFPPFPTAVAAPGIEGVGHSIFVLTETQSMLVVDNPNWREDWVVADDVRASSDLGAVVLEVLREMSPARIGVADGDVLPASMFNGWQAQLDVEWINVDADLWRLRRVKEPAEHEALRRAARVADAGLLAAVDAIRPGATEADVCAAGTAAALAAGADFVRYLRVHSGPWSAWSSRWPQATQRELEAGDLVMLDIIGAVDGYGFDVLRTTTVGAPARKHAHLFDAIQAATDAAVGAATPGTPVSEIVAAAHTVLHERGYSDAADSVGHGIGLETVEPPYLRADQDEVLLEGEVLCIEPAVWRKGWGGTSLEQEVIVAESPEIITPTPAWL